MLSVFLEIFLDKEILSKESELLFAITNNSIFFDIESLKLINEFSAAFLLIKKSLLSLLIESFKDKLEISINLRLSRLV